MGVGDEKTRSSLTAPSLNRTSHRRSINLEDLFRNKTINSSGAASPQTFAKSQPNIRYSDVISGVGEEVPFIDEGAQITASQDHLNASEPLLSKPDTQEGEARRVEAAAATRTRADVNHNKRKMDNQAMTQEMYELPLDNDKPRDYDQLTPPPSDTIESSETSSTTATSRRPMVKIERDQCNQLDLMRCRTRACDPRRRWARRCVILQAAASVLAAASRRR